MDQDLSGAVDMCELVDYGLGHKELEGVFTLEATSEEEEAKGELLSKPLQIREAASTAVKARSVSWAKLSWRDRLEEAKRQEELLSEDSGRRRDGAPSRSSSSSFSTAERKARKADSGNVEQPLSPSSPSSPSAAPDLWESLQRPAKPTAFPEGLLPDKFAISRMSQRELVRYSLSEDDLDFAGGDADASDELHAFRDYLLSASGPLDEFDVHRFIAKGTAGWVFLVESKESGSQHAMKVIRMTQARTGIKEWYISKLLRNLGVSNVVFTDERVYVMPKAKATSIITSAMPHAGPVPYYMCMIQELMPWGSLEDLAHEGELSPEILFEVLEDVANALATMHANKIQHRDIKPENIMVVINGTQVTEAKLCDFGSAQIGDNPEGCADDIRRFGVTLFSVFTGEEWLANRLIHEKHDALVDRLRQAVQDSSDPTLQRLPDVLCQILDGELTMAQIATILTEMGSAY
eukprot:TRINITY_DN14949_c0_g2_i1.p1 TRINITY_DN14949_c0_g2~~TRINITY_DN14949_c0_g2_i1.p1  ORF type:complete len:543 (+),score=88.04 TRINITY_DN14949_c0_g2_i1:240-1631(+)